MASNAVKNVVFCATVSSGVAMVLWWINPNTSTVDALGSRNKVSADLVVNSNDVDEDHNNSLVLHLSSNDSVVAELNRAFSSDWGHAAIEVSSAVSPLKVARRLSLGLSGTIPSLQEIRALEKQPAADRITIWVNHLLQQRRTSDFLAERLARAFVGVEDGPFLLYRRRRFVDWLSNQLFANRPYDKIVRDLLVDDGLWTDSPAVNFYTRNIVPDVDKDNVPDPILLAGRTTRAFMAIRLDCLQCHDDFMDEIYLGDADSTRAGVQTDFHQLAAFFSETRNTFFGIGDVESGKIPYEYQLLGEDEVSVLKPGVPYADNLLESDGSLRQQLMGWITHPDNRPFARAIVNRMWAIMTGQPLVDPVDNIPLYGPFPQAMEVLTDDFVDHDFNLHRLIHLIAKSDAFQKDSDAEFEIRDVHTQSCSVFPMTRLRPDQIANAVIQATSMTTVDGSAGVLSRLKAFDQLTQFIGRFGDPGENEFESRGETVTQKLLMLNGSMVSNRLKENTSVVDLHWLSPSDEKTIETIFLATLTRRPTEVERTYFLERLENGNTSKRQSVADIYWSLINSLEFSWNH